MILFRIYVEMAGVLYITNHYQFIIIGVLVSIGPSYFGIVFYVDDFS